MPPVIVKKIPTASLEAAVMNANNELVKPAAPVVEPTLTTAEPTQTAQPQADNYFPIMLTLPGANGTGTAVTDPNAETEEQRRKRMIWIVGGIIAALVLLLLAIVLMKKSK